MSETILTDPLSLFGDKAPRKIISLVPSWTASLYDLHLGNGLIGITDYCPSASDGITGPARVGSTKNPRVDQIVQLQPDLVIANREENSRETVEQISLAGIPVWLTFPKTVNDMIADLWMASALFRSEFAVQMIQILEKSAEWAELALIDQEPVRYFCPIWQDHLENGEPWWMGFNADTYSSDVLRLVNGANVFANRKRRYPFNAEFNPHAEEDAGDRDTRYPRVSMAEILQLQPEVILLPTEPYPYQEKDIAEFFRLFENTPAGQSGRIHVVDGSLIHWPGTILSKALDELSWLFISEIDSSGN